MIKINFGGFADGCLDPYLAGYEVKPAKVQHRTHMLLLFL